MYRRWIHRSTGTYRAVVNTLCEAATDTRGATFHVLGRALCRQDTGTLRSSLARDTFRVLHMNCKKKKIARSRILTEPESGESGALTGLQDGKITRPGRERIA